MPYKNKKKKAEFQREYMRNYRKSEKYKKFKEYDYNGIYQRRWATKNKDTTVRKIRLKRYGLNLEDYNSLFIKQKGKCAICGKHQSELKRSLAVDHCHKTGRVRGLLCRNCNTAIGMLNEDIENLRCAILYLNEYALAGQPEKPQLECPVLDNLEE